MNDRIKKWLDYKKLNASNFADKINVNRSTMSHILSGRNNPSFDFVKKMINVFPDLNIRWLLSGEGIMTYNETGVEKNRDYSRNIEKVIIFYDDNSFDELKS